MSFCQPLDHDWNVPKKDLHAVAAWIIFTACLMSVWNQNSFFLFQEECLQHYWKGKADWLNHSWQQGLRGNSEKRRKKISDSQQRVRVEVKCWSDAEPSLQIRGEVGRARRCTRSLSGEHVGRTAETKPLRPKSLIVYITRKKPLTQSYVWFHQNCICLTTVFIF